MAEVTRYRLESDVPCVDVKVQRIDQLLDNRDPAPFRERDLDPGVAAYLLDATEDLASRPAFSIVFWLEQPTSGGEIEQAFRAHFQDEMVRLRRKRHRDRRTGTVMLVPAVALVLLLVALAQLIGASVPGSVGAGLKEGLVISSWVVLWRPFEILIYGWIPLRQERALVERLLGAQISIRAGRPPSASTSSSAVAG